MSAPPTTRLVCDSEAGTRLDQFLASSLPQCSRSRIQKWIRAGDVTVAGVVATRPSAALAPGSEIVLRVSPSMADADAPRAEAIPLEVLYEDEDLVAINKPAGLLVHAGAGQHDGTLVNALLHRYGAYPGGAEDARPGIVHRLDRGTSGVMVVARHPDAQFQLARQFHERSVGKFYLALAQGALEARGEIELAIVRDRMRRTRMATRQAMAERPRGRRPPTGVARPARTSYRRIELLAGGRASYLEVQIHTGRTHQIRVHLAALRHPVLGDTLYGAAARFDGDAIPRPLLHAARLELHHPRTGEALAFTAPPAMDFLQWLERLRGAGKPK